METEFLLVTGPMFAGKSKYLIENYYDNPDVDAFSPLLDTRDAEIVSRAYSDKKIPCTKVSTLKQAHPKKNIVLVDEYQFFSPEDLKDFVIKSVEEAGPNPCPPIVVGVGIGGTFDKAAYLAKKALIRPVDVSNEDPFYANLEKELLQEINNLGIGPQGFGGKTTALAVNIASLSKYS